MQLGVLASLAPEQCWPRVAELAATLRNLPHPLQPFHWELEFPEAFISDNPGFDAIVGNPPYLGATKISGANGKTYFSWISTQIVSDADKADLIAYFVRRIASLTRKSGAFGILSTSSICEGDTRTAALVWLRERGQIYNAIRKMPWPGEANVDVSVIHFRYKRGLQPVLLDGEEVGEINSFLNEGGTDYDPVRLIENRDVCFEGFVPYGDGFILDEATDPDLVNSFLSNLRQSEPQSLRLIFSYLGGDEVTDDPCRRPMRQVVYTGKMKEAQLRSNHPLVYEFLRQRVFGFRASKSERVSSMPWWQFLWPRPKLFQAMRRLESCFVISRVTKHHAFVSIPTNCLPSTRLSVVCWEDYGHFSVLQSRVHELWARTFGASRGATFNYSPSTCFLTFPFPSPANVSALQVVGREYHRF